MSANASSGRSAGKTAVVQTANGPGALTPGSALTKNDRVRIEMASKPYTPAPSAEQVRALLRYEPKTGRLYWLRRDRSLFQTDTQWKTWNTRFAGAEAFTTVNSCGYRTGAIFGTKYQSHRVIWLIQTGEWPSSQIDHCNGQRGDNKWENLRSVTRHENMRNQKIASTNTSGATGVYFDARSGRWKARIGINGGMKHLGAFPTREEAIQARAAANVEHGFSARHGAAE